MGNYEVKNISKRLSFYLSISRGSKNEKIYTVEGFFHLTGIQSYYVSKIN